MDTGAGWLPDPEHEDQERYWNGSAWTDQVRPVSSLSSLHLSDHVPPLRRALAGSTADIDAVEDRLSTLFDRTGEPGGGAARGGGGTSAGAAAGASAGAGAAAGASAGAGARLVQQKLAALAIAEPERALHEEFDLTLTE